MTTKEALNLVRHGKAVTRRSWDKDGYYLCLFSEELCVCERNGAIAAKVKNVEYYADFTDWYLLDDKPETAPNSKNRKKAEEVAREAIEAMNATEGRKKE